MIVSFDCEMFCICLVKQLQVRLSCAITGCELAQQNLFIRQITWFLLDIFSGFPYLKVFLKVIKGGVIT